MSVTRIQTKAQQYTRHIIQCRKIPQAHRDTFRSLGGRETYREIKPSTLGEKAVYRVELTPEEVDRVRSASNLISLDVDVVRYPHVNSSVPSAADLAFHDASDFASWGWLGEGVDVGVIDTGLSSAISGMFNIKAAATFVGGSVYTDEGDHGTGVAAIAVPTQSRLVFGKNAIGSGGSSDSNSIAALYWMVDEIGVQVVNMSFGGYEPNTAFDDAIKHAESKGAPVFISAGNEGEVGNPIEYPAYYGRAVGALDRSTGGRAAFSNYGDWVDMWASGVDVSTYDASGSLTTFSGSSVATPVATFLFASQLGKTKASLSSTDVADSMSKNLGENGKLSGADSAGALPGYC